MLKQIGAVGLALASTVAFADSQKLLFPDNGHYYQRFDQANINWNTAKLSCQALKAHLATISGDTSNNPSGDGDSMGIRVNSPESTFINAQLFGKPNAVRADYLIGAYFDKTKSAWAWVTGEPIGKGFLPLSAFDINNSFEFLSVNAIDGLWYTKPTIATPFEIDARSLSNEGYLCEWDGDMDSWSARLAEWLDKLKH